MKNVIMAKPGEDSFVRWIKKRVDNNLNFLCLFEGPPGSSKSWSALSIARQIDPEFNPREQVAFNFKELMRIINKFNDVEIIDAYNKLQNLNIQVTITPLHKRKYKLVIFDEAQTNLNNREWQSKVNKLFNYLLSTFRHQNIIVLFTSPYSDFLDSASMKLLHAKFELRGWNKKTGKAHIRPKLLQYNSKMKKFYEHSLFVIANGKMNKLVNWFIDKPSDDLTIPYEQMKTAFTQALNKKITAELEAMDKPVENKQELNPDSMQLDLWEEASKGYTKIQNIVDRLSVKYGRPVNLGQVGRNIMSMRKKGYDIRQYKVKGAV